LTRSIEAPGVVRNVSREVPWEEADSVTWRMHTRRKCVGAHTPELGPRGGGQQRAFRHRRCERRPVLLTAYVNTLKGGRVVRTCTDPWVRS
jgi:hypothetical protein